MRLLAQAQLPAEFDGIPVVVVGTIVVIVLLVGACLVTWQVARKAMSEEMRLQRLADDEAQRVEVQSPLAVRAHVEPVTKPEFEKALKEAHGRMNREKAERDAALAERKKARDEELAAMKAATEALRESLEAEVLEMRRLVEAREISGEQRANRINDRIDELSKAVGQMPDRLFALINNAKAL